MSQAGIASKGIFKPEAIIRVLLRCVNDATGDDLLNDKTTGSYKKHRIAVYRKDGNGNVIPMDFAIRPGFSYGNEKFNFNTLFLGNLTFLQKSPADVIYLKLGEKEAGSYVYNSIRRNMR
ncbi:hypothetical protein ACFJIV_11900 [Mucilaginibacter sp. UC70_90]